MAARHQHTLLMTALAGLLVSSTCPAQAQQSAPPEAEELYNKAAALVKNQDYENGCPALAQVVKMVPHGGGVRLDLAQCYEAWGKLASALKEYHVAEELAATGNQQVRKKDAAAGISRLKAKVATLTVAIPEALRALPALVVILDGEALEKSKWGSPLPVDKGTHTLVVSATGYESVTIPVDIKNDGVTHTAGVPPLKSIAPLPGPSNIIAPEALSVRSVGSSSAEAAPSDAPRSKVPGLAVGGLGLSALIAGGVLVGVASGVTADINSKLPRDTSGRSLCQRTARPGEDPSCADLRSSATSGSAMGNAGIGVLVGGGVLVATGAAYLFLASQSAAPHSKRATRVVPVVGSEGGGLVWTGSF